MLFSDNLDARTAPSGQTFRTVTSGHIDFPTEAGLISVEDSISEVCCNCFSGVERGPYACIAADGLCGVCEGRCQKNCGVQ